MERDAKSGMTLHDKVFGFMPFIRMKEYGETPILYREVEWPWFRLIVTQQAMQDHMFTIPHRFGFTYHDWNSDTWHYHLFPFNFVIALSRRVYQVFGWELPQRFAEWERQWRKNHAVKPEVLVQSDKETDGKPAQRSDSTPIE